MNVQILKAKIENVQVQKGVMASWNLNLKKSVKWS